MVKKLQTQTTTAQRAAIWAILVLTIASTVALYIGMLLSSKNNQTDAQKQKDQIAQYQEEYKKYQEKVKEQAKELSAKYYDNFKDYEKYPAAFNGGEVKELATNDLKVGDGVEFGDETTEFSAYYIGWKPDGTVFDSSFENGALKTPLSVTKNGSSWGLITGWPEGMKGMKVGGIRELTIPADKAYGSAGSENQQDSAKSIAPNTPLKFVVYLIPKVEEVPTPDLSKYQFNTQQ